MRLRCLVVLTPHDALDSPQHPCYTARHNDSDGAKYAGLRAQRAAGWCETARKQRKSTPEHVACRTTTQVLRRAGSAR